MEKFCPKCHKVHEDMSDKFCSNCGTKLKAREKRKPLPPELRHKILVRDGYRCRECGKSRNETSLEIDHIYPLSKGGPTIEDNLWVLCRECNQAKKDDVWKDDDIEVTRNELANLENQLREAEKNLQLSTDDDEIRDYKYKIKKFKTEYIPEVTNKLNKLIHEQKELEIKRKEQQKENIRRENLLKDLYILDDELILELCNYYTLTESSNEDNLRLLIDMYDEQEIYSTISSIEKELKEEATRKELYDKLYNTLSDDELMLFINEFSMQGSKEDVLNELVNLFSEDDIELLRIKLIKKEEKRIADELEKERQRLAKIAHNNLKNKLTDYDLTLFSNEFNLPLDADNIIDYLIDNYPEDKIDLLRNKLHNEDKRRNELRAKLVDEFNNHDFELFSKYFSLGYSVPLKIAEYLVNNYTQEEIYNLNIKLRKNNILNELKLEMDIKQLIFLCKYFSYKDCTKDSLLNKLENESLNDIEQAIASMKK